MEVLRGLHLNLELIIDSLRYFATPTSKSLITFFRLVGIPPLKEGKHIFSFLDSYRSYFLAPTGAQGVKGSCLVCACVRACVCDFMLKSKERAQRGPKERA